MPPIHIPSYSKIYALGHSSIRNLLGGPVVIEEKIDGSQFTMTHSGSGRVSTRSKGQDLDPANPEKMFSVAVEVARSLRLNPGWVYRCEYLRSAKHNVLAYDRTPDRHLMIYDIEIAPNVFLSPENKAEEAERIGLECVPLIYQGWLTSLEAADSMLDRVSILGGQKIEGLVIKNYDLLNPDGKIAMAKIVDAAFKEKHAAKGAKQKVPGQGDAVALLIASLTSEARFHKALQHLREAGQIDGSPKDIGPLMKEAKADILAEEKEWIADQLFKHFIDAILKGATADLPHWYKRHLAEASMPIAA